MSSFPEPRAAELPAVDERVIAPESRYELLDGRLVHVAPADLPHGVRHAQILALIEAHVGLEFQVACDMLTRTSRTDDFAPDVSVFPAAPHPETGGRQLEQLAFEVVSTQSLGHAGKKAAKLVARGVRRVFAVDVERSRLLAWSTAIDDWSQVDAPCIEDPALDVALPVDALVHTVKADDAVARALLAKHNPVLEATKTEAHAQGHLAGKREALLLLLGVRGISLDDAARERILQERDPARLDRWLTRAATDLTTAELFAAP